MKMAKKALLIAFVLIFIPAVAFTVAFANDETGIPVEPAFITGDFTPVTGWDMMGRLGAGINIGNTMEAIGEGWFTGCPLTEQEVAWGEARVEQWHFEAIAEKGFQSVRIPLNWTTRTENLQINPIWMDRVQEVVDWALGAGLYVVINAHHERDLYDPMYYGPLEDAEAWLLSVWGQISERFKYYPEQLIFEPMNEPRPGLDGWFWSDELHATQILALAQVSRQLNLAALDLIRTSGGNNAQRIVMMSTIQGSLRPDLFEMPDDDFVMLGGFFYPGFADDAQIARELDHIREALYSAIPVVLKETNIHNIPSGDALAQEVLSLYQLLADRGVASMWWNHVNSLEGFQMFNRHTGEWDYSVTNAFLQAYGITPGQTLEPPRLPSPFPLILTTSVTETGLNVWAGGAGNAVPPNVLNAAVAMVIEFEGPPPQALSFVRWHPDPWAMFGIDHYRVTTEPGRIIFDLRGTSGGDLAVYIENAAYLPRITRIFLTDNPFGTNPPTGLPNITWALAAMLALMAVSSVLWGILLRDSTMTS
ncbi:MAG: glycoside hydrolase family 5 protein [Defluviitaleaceae bacterium]|nr:glycoside hydrolase family 5 protein [Defluviitaleaceae bacterium]